MTFYRSSDHTARNAKRCDGCRRWIEAGQKYRKIVCSQDGDFAAAKFHIDCEQLRSELFVLLDHRDDEGLPWDNCESLTESGNARDVQDVLDGLRGYFPHAVTRIEFSLRDWLECDE